MNHYQLLQPCGGLNKTNNITREVNVATKPNVMITYISSKIIGIYSAGKGCHNFLQLTLLLHQKLQIYFVPDFAVIVLLPFLFISDEQE